MKVVFGFLGGIFFGGVLMVMLSFGLPALAQSDNTTSDNFSLSDLLPDIEKIYRDALLTPFLKAEDKIYDKDIADYYHTLLDKSGFYEPSSR
ncbi:MAG: hypothetical protein V1823_01955 [Chloroflexota bacterium]